MKRMIVVAVLALLVLALAPTVSADEFGYALQGVFDTVNQPIRAGGQNLCDAAEPGTPMWWSWCRGVVVNPRTGRVERYNPNSVAGQRHRGFRGDDLWRARLEREYPMYRRVGGYGGYYDDGYYGGPGVSGRTAGAVVGGVVGGVAARGRHPLVQGAAILGGAALGAVVGDRLSDHSERRRDGEKPSDCVKRVTKDLQKSKVPFSSEQVFQFCSGQSVGGGASEAPAPVVAPGASDAPELSEAPQQFTTPPAPRHTGRPVPQRAPSVYTQGDKLCNDTDERIAVFIDGVRVGTLGPRQVTSLSQLPRGRINYLPLK